MIRCACDLSFKDADSHLLHQASMGLAATFELVDKARALGRDGVPMSELAEAALDSNARHRALVPGIDYGEEIMPEEKPVEAPKPDPFDVCKFCMHHRRAHDAAGCGKWVERSPSHGPHDGFICACTRSAASE